MQTRWNILQINDQITVVAVDRFELQGSAATEEWMRTDAQGENEDSPRWADNPFILS